MSLRFRTAASHERPHLAPSLLWAAAFAGLVFILACSDARSSRPQAKARPVPVSVAVAELRDVPVELKAVGKVEALVTIAVKSRVMGQVVKVHFKEGEMVQMGQPLFTIDQRPYEVSLKESEAKLARDIALARKAEDDFKRYKSLAAQKTVSASQYEQFQTEALVRQATVKADQAEVENARLQLSYCFIKSPVTGVTGNLWLNEGNLVKANDDKAMVVIHQVQPIYVNFAVPEKHLGQIMELRKTRQLKAQVVVAGHETRPLLGQLTFVDNLVDTATGTVRLKATFPNQDLKLWPGQFARTTLFLTTLKDLVVVPAQAVLTGQKGAYLYILNPDGTVAARQVTAGLSLNDHIVIANGLKPGEKVITDGHSRLVPGAKVIVKGGPSPDKPDQKDRS
jgi:multidrug efflux system membrane fusion protein